MNAFQKFCSEHPFGFVTEADMPALIAIYRLCPCLVRCGGGRFTAPAQNVAHFIACVKAGGDYVRDVAITSDAMAGAETWQPEPPPRTVAPRPPYAPLQRALAPRSAPRVDPWGVDYGGVFDGSGVTSDADPGL